MGILFSSINCQPYQVEVRSRTLVDYFTFHVAVEIMVFQYKFHVGITGIDREHPYKARTHTQANRHNVDHMPYVMLITYIYLCIVLMWLKICTSRETVIHSIQFRVVISQYGHSDSTLRY